MAYTQADIDKVRRLIVSGVQSISHGDTSRTNANIKDLRDLLEIMEADVNGRGRRRTLATFRSGA